MIVHAAFTIALAQLCFERDRPHPGFVILDTPLITYRPPEPGEAPDPNVLDVSVALRFYDDIQTSFDGQIIVMENMYPPNGLRKGSVDVHFTGKESFGRYGYFPVSIAA